VEEWVDPRIYVEKYSKVGELVPEWQALEAPTGLLYSWRPDDTYIQPSPLFEGEVKIGDIAVRGLCLYLETA